MIPRRMRTTAELTSPKQKKLYDLLQREELGAKRMRTGHLLSQQFIKKYGGTGHSSLITFIQSTVKAALLNSPDGNLTETMLESLETSIRDAADKLKTQTLGGGITIQGDINHSNNNSNESESKMDEVAETVYADTIHSRGGPRTAGDPSMPPNDDFDPNQWAVMNAFLALNDEDKSLREKSIIKKKMSDFKLGLDNQTQLMKARSQQDTEEKQKLADMTRSAVSKVEEENRLARQRQESRMQREKAIRLGQIEERERIRQKEKEMKLAQEQRDIEYNLKQMLEEEARKRLKKDQQKRMQDAVKVENARNQAMKDEMLKKQAEYDTQQTKEYYARQERSDQAKAQAFKSRVDTLKTFSANFDKVSGTVQREERKKEEGRVNDEVDSKNRADLEREQAKKDARYSEMQRSKDFNQNLISRKEMERQKEKEDAMRYREMLERETEKARLKELEAAEKRRAFSKDVKRTLDEQVQKYNNNKVAHTVLSTEEIALNKDIITKMERDFNLREKLQAKMGNPVSPAKETIGIPTSMGIA